MRWTWWAWPLLAGVCTGAQAQTRGWLRFVDGNTLTGELIQQSADGGQFRSDRFGMLNFKQAEARFEAAPPAPPAPAPVPAPAARADAGGDEPLGWRPGEWSIGMSGYWRRDSGSTTSDVALDLDSTWKSRQEEIRLALSANYKVVDRAVDTNDQSGGLRWLHEVASSPWVTLGQFKLDRSTFSIDPLPTLDYALVQASVGAGWRARWPSGGQTLVTLNYDRLMLELLRLDRRLYARAMSVLLENRMQLTPRIDFSNTLLVYRWRDRSIGFDSDAEVSYRLTDHLSVGLRWELRRNAVSLDTGNYRRLSLTTRLGF